MTGGRLKELLRKYGRVAFGVHMSVSATSIAGLYVAIQNNVDVESIFRKFNLPDATGGDQTSQNHGGATVERNSDDASIVLPDSQENIDDRREISRNRTTELAASTGGALALAILCNKALFPIRVPITIALTPPIARFLARRNIIKSSL